MSDRLTAWVRTVVPGLWAALVAWLVSLGLPADIVTAVDGLGQIVLVPVALAVVYQAVQWVAKRAPVWLAVILTGSTATPTYRTSTKD
ncbi:hypothetical protein [Actinokineospora globicatena]|uniref:Uncharacterized protein n=1 Tax=Actinokineospora globicatena TaxID=103729 RepID=A0A9W6QNH7_9PSEU|nr:hypothetical protein [Actinokineospora globicatena]GLW91777.1 hypothetical protein Aglo03_25930 [Actinokineospora globicatena]